MKKLFSSFYARLAAVFLILLLIMGAVQILISVQASISFVKEADQRMNTDLAESIALEFKPFLKDSMDMAGIEHMMHYLMVMNPHIEIYLLDSTGQVMAFFAVPEKKVQRERVSIDPINRFIDSDEAVSVLGDDPRNPNRQKPFTAARMNIMGNRSGYIYVILGGEQYDQASGEIREGFLMSTVSKGLLVSLAFTAIIGLVLFFFMTRRLRAVTDVVTGFKEGDYRKRLPEKSDDDFGQLSRAFNQMADTIVNNMQELKRTDDLRRELIANVSHDLRSPLASIQGYLETIMMKLESLSKDEQKRFLSICLDNANNLSRLVAELFELSKLDAHQIEPQNEVFSVSELMQDVAVKFKPKAEKKSIRIDTDFDQQLPPVEGDIAMIERALSNLIENAINYSSENGQVALRSSYQDNSVRISISDSGPGISDDDLPHIFSRYYRSNREEADKNPGAGLGLAIAKRILELHDSDIHVNSRLNEGTTFYFDLKSVRERVPAESMR